MFTSYTVNTTQSRIAFTVETRTSLVVLNNSAVLIYIGAKGQDTNGFPIAINASASFKIPEDDPTEELWCIAAGAASDVRVYEGFGKK